MESTDQALNEDLMDIFDTLLYCLQTRAFTEPFEVKDGKGSATVQVLSFEYTHMLIRRADLHMSYITRHHRQNGLSLLPTGISLCQQSSDRRPTDL